MRKLAAFAVGIVTALGLSPTSSADLGSLSRLASLGAEAANVPDARAYAALRRIWAEWDRDDPAGVEEELAAVAQARRGSTRVYAQLLEAYGRRRRGDLDGARAQIASLGYIGKWLVAGAFDNKGKTGLLRPYEPEVEDAPESGKAYDGKERKVSWRAVPFLAPYGWIDTSSIVRPTSEVCIYATTFVTDKTLRTGTRTVSVWAGSSGAFEVFWNGALALQDTKYRDFDAERMGRSVTLAPGYNRVLVKACGSDSAPIFTLRVAAADGSPDAHIEADTSFTHGPEARALYQKQKLPPSGVAGPVQAFFGTEKSTDAVALEAYATYLVSTQSDDESEHLARDLATRAAQRAPTVQRTLLASRLVENRNQSADWIAKAEALVAKGGVSSDDAMDVLLARATHERTGMNWRDAVPYYDRALARDPDNAQAVLARVELYGEANLRATALAYLDRALGRRPRSVGLVRAMVDLLRQEDRTSEADEMEDRYAALRFDDPESLRSKIELAVARRNTPSAVHWVDRLIAADPDSTETLMLAASTYLKLGDTTRAVALYKRSLDLAPEDTTAMQRLADVYGMTKQESEQVTLLRHLLEIAPQNKSVRDYVAHLEPSKPKPDELYAVPFSAFLVGRKAPAGGYDRRTLVDITVATVFENGLSSHFHQIVFQPLTEPAAEAARDYGFGFELGSQAVRVRGVHVFRTDGTVDDAFDTAMTAADDPSVAMYTSAAAYRIRLPRLSAGDVVELQYRIDDVAENNELGDYFGDIDYFQASEPVTRAEYVLITPKKRTFYFNKPSIPVAKTVEDKGDQRIYRFVAQDVAPMLPEPLQPPYTEVLGHIHVSTYKSWDDMGAWYWGLVKDQLVADDEVRQRVAEVTKGKTTDRDKVIAVYDYVVQKTRYVALEFGIHGFKPYRCSQIFARGFGDCKDKASLIVTMLKELGIPATLVIVRTDLRGDFEDFPASLAPFDHAIAYVPSLDMYLDGTAEYSGAADFPAMDRGALALQVNEGHPKLVHLPDPPASASVTSRTLEATLSPDGSAVVDWRTNVRGVSAPSWRVRYHAEALRKQRLQEDLAGELPGIDIRTIEAGDMENVEAPVSLHVTGKATSFGRRDGDTLSAPIGAHASMVHDFALLSQRKLDLRIPAQTTRTSDYLLKLPAGAKLAAMPGAAASTTPFGTFSMAVEPTPGGARIKTTVTMTKTHIAVSEYPAFRSWCESVDAALGQRLVVSLGGH